MVLRAAAYHSGPCPSQRGATVSEVTQSLRTRYPKTYKGWCNFSADLVSAGILQGCFMDLRFSSVFFFVCFCFAFCFSVFLFLRTRSEETPSFAAKLSCCLCSQCGQDVRLFLHIRGKQRTFTASPFLILSEFAVTRSRAFARSLPGLPNPPWCISRSW